MYEDVLGELIVKNETKLILLVIDGLGGTTDHTGRTELETAKTPNMDALARSGSCGFHYPVGYGITPGSGPGHLGLFGYDPLKYKIGRGILEAFGVGMDVRKGDLAIRGNFATMKNGLIVDRRAGRIATSECERLVKVMSDKIKIIEDIEVEIRPGKDYRFAAVFRGKGLSEFLSDADPQKNDLPPVSAKPLKPDAEKSARIINKFIQTTNDVLIDEPLANTILVRGYAMLPDITPFPEKYGLHAVGIATYPMYRGLARLVGMDTPQVGETIEDEFALVKKIWNDYDFFFIHIKKADSAGEDGNKEGKIKIIEEVDEKLLALLKLNPDVLVITGDHSTPYVLKSHSWHPVPMILSSKFAFVDNAQSFSERECAKGILGHIPSQAIIMYMLANSGRLAKFGA